MRMCLFVETTIASVAATAILLRSMDRLFFVVALSLCYRIRVCSEAAHAFVGYRHLILLHIWGKWGLYPLSTVYEHVRPFYFINRVAILANYKI